jgi:hypothetical protein
MNKAGLREFERYSIQPCRQFSKRHPKASQPPQRDDIYSSWLAQAQYEEQSRDGWKE